ncbi:DUF2487 family protein [Aneurinibacillus tyrosinisolvens]|uniref:DUF2487 family protein n=1 Tax=Aneurinibacillus tyrosinisolvens TaxID=1443435 RepID=UPI00063EE21F|nr:DUF2487 family protein [Aneurinibacillus tyrosinisolvens]
MRWKADDMEKVIGMEEHVDTLLYPVCVSPVKWDQNWLAAQLWLERISSYAEQQLTGRLFLFQSLSIAREGNYHTTAHPFIEQSIQALRARFPYHLVITNEEELAETLREAGVHVYVISDVPEESVTTKAFLEKALIEGNKIVKTLISLWQKE